MKIGSDGDFFPDLEKLLCPNSSYRKQKQTSQYVNSH